MARWDEESVKASGDTTFIHSPVYCDKAPTLC